MAYHLLTQKEMAPVVQRILKDRGPLAVAELEREVVRARLKGSWLRGTYFYQRVERMAKSKLITRIKHKGRVWYINTDHIHPDVARDMPPRVLFDYLQDRGVPVESLRPLKLDQ